MSVDLEKKIMSEIQSLKISIDGEMTRNFNELMYNIDELRRHSGHHIYNNYQELKTENSKLKDKISRLEKTVEVLKSKIDRDTSGYKWS